MHSQKTVFNIYVYLYVTNKMQWKIVRGSPTLDKFDVSKSVEWRKCQLKTAHLS